MVEVVFAYLAECSVLNAFILLCTIRTGSEHEFCYVSQRLALACALIGDFSSRRRSDHPTTGETVNLRRLNTSYKHFPKRGKDKRQSVVCIKHGERHESRVVCRVCEVYLCDAFLIVSTSISIIVSPDISLVCVNSLLCPSPKLQ